MSGEGLASYGFWMVYSVVLVTVLSTALPTTSGQHQTETSGRWTAAQVS